MNSKQKGNRVNSKQKGNRGERELSHKLREHGYSCRRGQQFSGANGDADVVGLLGIHIECKRTERLNLYDAMAQAVGDARSDELPAVFSRHNNSGWLVTMRLDDWIQLYKESPSEDQTGVGFDLLGKELSESFDLDLSDALDIALSDTGFELS